MGKRVKRVLEGIALACACFAIYLTSPVLGHAQGTTGVVAHPQSIAFDGQRQRLKVSLDGQPFLAVLEEVARQTGTQIAVYGSDYDDLTMEFGYVPLLEALGRLLQATSYVMHASEDGLPVWVL